MATAPPVTTSERLWSEEVGRAEADSPVPRQPAVYEWSNGREHLEGLGPYGPNAIVPEGE